MTTMGLDPEDVRRAARNAQSASEQVAALPLGYGPEQLAEALPGSESAAVATKLASGWDAESNELAKAIDAYGQALHDAVRRYNADDGGNAAQFGAIELDTFEGLS